MIDKEKRYVAFLRGINVGGHHKVPMSDLKRELQKLELKNVVTLLNSGNIIFDTPRVNTSKLEKMISKHLTASFGFPIPTIVRKAEMISELFRSDPFKGIERTKDHRCYVTFLRENANTVLTLPWKSADSSFEIIQIKDKIIVSFLDLSLSKTPKAMEVIERCFGKDITTRNWNTIERIEKKL